jgi:hypothetical protein
LSPESNGYEPITDPFVAAFEVGRWLNRLAFHLQQAWFFSGDYHVEAAREAARALGRAQVLVPAVAVPPVADRERVRQEISSGVEGLIGQLESEDHLDAFTNLEMDLQSAAYSPELNGPPSDHRRRLLDPVFKELATIRELVRPHLNDQKGQALRLGEKIDQGLSRPDIYLHLDRPPEAEQAADEACPKGTTPFLEGAGLLPTRTGPWPANPSGRASPRPKAGGSQTCGNSGPSWASPCRRPLRPTGPPAGRGPGLRSRRRRKSSSGASSGRPMKGCGPNGTSRDSNFKP